VQTGQEQPRSLGTPLNERIVKRIRREIEREFGPGDDVPTEELRWRLLPPGELSEERVRRYYVGLQNKNRGAQYDPDRIVKALSLDPKQRYQERRGRRLHRLHVPLHLVGPSCVPDHR
jgi:hypothetical protein